MAAATLRLQLLEVGNDLGEQGGELLGHGALAACKVVEAVLEAGDPDIGLSDHPGLQLIEVRGRRRIGLGRQRRAQGGQHQYGD